jgi:hypothetical protein
MVKLVSLFKSDSHLSDEGVALYVDALKLRRSEELPDEVRDHAANCRSCRKEVTGLFSLLVEENYSAMAPHPFFDRQTEGRDKNARWIYRIAALFVAGIGIALFAYLVYPGRPDVKSVPPHASSGNVMLSDSAAVNGPGDSGGEDAAGTLYADNFARLPELEGLVEAETRSSSIDAAAPKAGITVSQPVIFDWKAEVNAPLLLSVLTNKDSLVHRSRIAKLPYVLRSSLAPGLYYWKLENGEEVVFVGKFFVR